MSSPFTSNEFLVSVLALALRPSSLLHYRRRPLSPPSRPQSLYPHHLRSPVADSYRVTSRQKCSAPSSEPPFSLPEPLWPFSSTASGSGRPLHLKTPILLPRHIHKIPKEAESESQHDYERCAYTLALSSSSPFPRRSLRSLGSNVLFTIARVSQRSIYHVPPSLRPDA